MPHRLNSGFHPGREEKPRRSRVGKRLPPALPPRQVWCNRKDIMRKNSPSSVLVLGLLALAVLLNCSGCATSPSTKTGTGTMCPLTPPVEPTSVGPSKPEAVVFMVPYHAPPKKIDLCGEPVPTERQEVLERLDKEFTLIVYNHAQVYLWLKRMERYFPWIDERLSAQGLPSDLKYVAIAESDLLPNACSPKGAAGPWQFMPATGRNYGLDQRGDCDERYDFEMATESAFRYLRNLNNRFKSWTLAIAAYNCGEGRIQEQMRTQGTRDFYQMKLPQETERYVLRILAIKAVLGSPEQYGYHLPRGEGYPPFKVDRVKATFSRTVSIQSVAAAAGTNYREFKRLNPVFRGDDISPGTYELKLPQGSGAIFQKNHAAAATSTADVSPASPSKTGVSSEDRKAADARGRSDSAKGRSARVHVVKKGETLSGIARSHQVSVHELQRANKLKGSVVTPGQKLRIP